MAGREYKLVSSNAVKYFGYEVSKLMNEGWDPWGNPFYAPDSDGRAIYYQAMVKYDSDTGEAILGRLDTILADQPAQGYNVGNPTMIQHVAPFLQLLPVREGAYSINGIPFGPVGGDGPQCACFDQIGDNVECPVHSIESPNFGEKKA